MKRPIDVLNVLACEKGFVQYFETRDEDYLILCEIQRWLQETHKIYIQIFPDDNDNFTGKDWRATLYELDFGESHETHYLGHKVTENSYIEALEKGIEEALKLIKNKK